jgi:2-dehydro-3-deoxygluconokinase
MSFEVITLGEAMLRLSVPAGTSLETAGQLDLHVAGAEANTAIALAQLGRSVTWVSCLPGSPLGRRVSRELLRYGVDVSHVKWLDEQRMGVYYVELAAPPRPVGVIYDRAGSTAAAMTSEDFPFGLLDTARVVHLTGITPALSADCRHLALDVADRARSSDCLLTLDVNYRAKLWSPEEARSTLADLARGADAVVLTREDASDVFDLAGEPADVAERVRDELETDSLVLTLGDQGSVWVSKEGSGKIEAHPTAVIDRLGAGDALMAGIIDGLLAGDLKHGLVIGTALASLALGTNGDHVVTTRAEVARLIEGGRREVDR